MVRVERTILASFPRISALEYLLRWSDCLQRPMTVLASDPYVCLVPKVLEKMAEVSALQPP